MICRHPPWRLVALWAHRTYEDENLQLVKLSGPHRGVYGRSLSLFLGCEATLEVISPWTGRLCVAGNLPSTSAGTHHSWVDWRNEKPNALLKATPQRGIELTISVWIPVLRPLHVLSYGRTYRGFRSFVVQTPISHVRSNHRSGQVLATVLLLTFLCLFFSEFLCSVYYDSMWLIVCVWSISSMTGHHQTLFVSNALLA